MTISQNTLIPLRTALLVLNASRAFDDWDRVGPLYRHVGTYLDRFREAGVQVLYSSLVFAADGSDAWKDGVVPGETPGFLVRSSEPAQVSDSCAPQPGERQLERNRPSAFFESSLDEILRESGVDTLIVSGFSTNVCVDSTARDASFRNYRVVVLSDGSAPTPIVVDGRELPQDEHQAYALASLGAFATALSIDEALSLLHS